jgi:hypothetical protein
MAMDLETMLLEIFPMLAPQSSEILGKTIPLDA